jgi:hypothetical protein
MQNITHLLHMTLGVSIFMAALASAEPTNESAVLKLKDSPRLWVSQDTAVNLKNKLHTPYLKTEAQRIIADADWLVTADPVAEGEAGTYQQGTRAIASHLQCLTSAWVLTKDAKYREAAIRHLGNILTWNQISCEANPDIPAEREMMFCLSYGEHAADISLMYDLFRSDITPDEQKVFYAVLDRFYLKAALNCLKRPPWWANKEWSNWNGVCAGGIGMLALAFYDDRPECRDLIPFVEKSLGEYFKSYINNGGGNHEGTGYWNYGMHYALRYLLSWENATGRKHPAFDIEELAVSLNFPIDFTGVNFGDNDGWGPTGMFFIAAKRLNNPSAALRAAAYLPGEVKPRTKPPDRLGRTATGDTLYAADFIPTFEEMESLRQSHALKKDPVARVYDKLGWAALADDSAFPRLRLSARGGSSRIAGHGHIDLLSFKCMVNGQRMIEDQHGSGYSAATFTGRGHHIYDRSAAAKSTIFIDGLGCNENAVCKLTEPVEDKDLLGIRIDGSGVFMDRWARQFMGRLFLMVENKYWLIVDSANGHHLESRFHTYAQVMRGEDWATLKRGSEELSMTFAALGRGVMQESRGMPASPGQQTQILRWMSSKGRENLHVTAMNPGGEKLGLKLEKEKDGGVAITVTGADGYQRIIRVTSKLELKK